MAEGSTGDLIIERLRPGDKTRTARHAGVMNEIIDRLNAFTNATVKISEGEAAAGKFILSDSNMVLDLKQGLGIPAPPDTGTYVLGSIDSEVQWIATETCDCADGTTSIDGGDV